MYTIFFIALPQSTNIVSRGVCLGRDRMVVGFTTTWAISAYHHTNVVSYNPADGEVYSIRHYVIKFISDLRQVGGFLRVLIFSPPMKLTSTISVILLKVVFYTIMLTFYSLSPHLYIHVSFLFYLSQQILFGETH